MLQQSHAVAEDLVIICVSGSPSVNMMSHDESKPSELISAKQLLERVVLYLGGWLPSNL